MCRKTSPGISIRPITPATNPRMSAPIMRGKIPGAPERVGHGRPSRGGSRCRRAPPVCSCLCSPCSPPPLRRWPRDRPRRGRRARATRGRPPTSTGSAPPTSSPGTRTSRCARRSLSEVYYPDLSTPAFRGLQFAVTDGKTFVDREVVDDDPRHIEPVAPGVTATVTPLDRSLALPPGHRERPLAADQDLDHRPRARHRAAAACASRPRPGPRCACSCSPTARPATTATTTAGSPASRRWSPTTTRPRAPSPPRRRWPRPRAATAAPRATRGATCRTTSSSAPTPRSPATSCRARAPRSTARTTRR